MKRSDFMHLAIEQVMGIDAPAPAENLADFVERVLGVTWESEKPELPRKLIREREFVWNAVDDKGEEHFGAVDLSVLIGANLDNFTYRVLHEAFTAYNEREITLRKMENVQRCADRSDQLVDRWRGVIERALDELRSPLREPSFERILLILEQRA
jgi:hypothetical protein